MTTPSRAAVIEAAKVEARLTYDGLGKVNRDSIVLEGEMITRTELEDFASGLAEDMSQLHDRALSELRERVEQVTRERDEARKQAREVTAALEIAAHMDASNRCQVFVRAFVEEKPWAVADVAKHLNSGGGDD